MQAILDWIIASFLWVPYQVLAAVGNLFPTCSELGMIGLPVDILNQATQWLRLFWFILQWLPWGHLWNVFWIFLLYHFCKFLYNAIKWLITLIMTLV